MKEFCIVQHIDDNVSPHGGAGWYWWRHPEPDGSYGPFTTKQAAKEAVVAAGNTLLDIEVDYVVINKPGYRARVDEQTRLWVKGKPKHNDVDNECCPDFSCCRPELLACVEVRQAFVRAGDDDRYKFLSGFLGAALAGTDANVHIAGQHGDDA